MIVYLAIKARFREDILSNRIAEIALESFQAKLTHLRDTLKLFAEPFTG